jgi:hypothetical protein
MNLVETALYGILSGMISFSLYTSWIGYEGGSYEINPVLWEIVKTVKGWTGSWAWGILPFIPISILGVYIAAKLVDRDLRKTGYLHSFRVWFIGFILIQLPSVLHQSRIIRLPRESSLTFILSFVPVIVYVLFEVAWWKLRKRKITL